MKAITRNIFLLIAVFVVGVVLGFVFRPRIIEYRVGHSQFEILNTNIASDTFYDICTGERVDLMDTLSYKNRNLLAFWSPTCGYCKKFFKHTLNEKIVGIYCFPLIDDLDYLKFYVEKHNIRLPQLMAQKSKSLVPVDAFSIVATPTFVIIDDKGNTLAQYIGINEIDEMITFLYQEIS